MIDKLEELKDKDKFELEVDFLSFIKVIAAEVCRQIDHEYNKKYGSNISNSDIDFDSFLMSIYVSKKIIEELPSKYEILIKEIEEFGKNSEIKH